MWWTNSTERNSGPKPINNTCCPVGTLMALTTGLHVVPSGTSGTWHLAYRPYDFYMSSLWTPIWLCVRSSLLVSSSCYYQDDDRHYQHLLLVSPPLCSQINVGERWKRMIEGFGLFCAPDYTIQITHRTEKSLCFVTLLILHRNWVVQEMFSHNAKCNGQAQWQLATKPSLWGSRVLHGCMAAPGHHYTVHLQQISDVDVWWSFLINSCAVQVSKSLGESAYLASLSI